MKRLEELVRHPESLGAQDREMLEEVLKSHPWFEIPAFLLMKLALVTGDGKLLSDMRGRLALRLAAGPIPPFLLDEPDQTGRRETLEVIDRFLSVENKKIVPDPLRSEDQPDLAAYPDTPQTEAVSDLLAGIYLKQGLTDKALNVYRKLSLKFPEKSVYFADIIEEIKKNNHTNNR